MKTTAFLIRVTISLLLSLIPVTELENRIYSARMEFRGEFGKKREPQVVLFEVSTSQFHSPKILREIQKQTLGLGASMVLVATPAHFGELIPDSDGRTRRAALTTKGLYSLARTAYVQSHLDPEGLAKWDEIHLINFLPEPGAFPVCSFKQPQEPQCKNISGKIILISEESENYPSLHTPVGERSPIEVLANDIQTVIDHHVISQISFFGRLCITLMMILIAAFFIIYYPVMISALAISSTGAFLVFVVFQVLFQFFDFYIPSANIICSLLITYLIFTGYRLAYQENLQWRSLKQAHYLRELDQMKTNFLSLMSHDLKTPLAKIQAVVERLQRELQLPSKDRSDWKELIDSIENSNNEMKRFITSILNLSRIESQKVILHKKSNDINQLILQALKRLRPLAQQKNIKIEERLEPLFSIECDEDLMRQVLTNLIDNAIKYSPPNSQIIVRSSEEDGFVRVDVEDFGPGIPKDQLPFMFRKFSRFMRPIKEQVKGTGLGLYLSKYFIELHGGTIRLKSIEGLGSTFTFTLPLHGVEGETILG